MSLTSLLVPTFTQMLGTLSKWLDKAQGDLPAAEAEALLSARLAPDMFPLSTQIRFACVQAYEAVYRLQGESFPDHVAELRQEGRDAGERPGTLADAQARIAATLAFLDSVPRDALDLDPEAPVAHDLPNGMIFDMTAGEYARDWAIGQFYFHVMTAYAILRSESLALGKADYVQHLFGHIRPAE